MKSPEFTTLRNASGGSSAFRPNLIASILFLFLLAVLPVLLAASPQQSWRTRCGRLPWLRRNDQPIRRIFRSFPTKALRLNSLRIRNPGLRLMLRRLGTTARLMQTVAHPDDEDGGMLTLESRGQGASVLLMTLNRGEGGQNKIGSNLSDVLGVLRTLELLAADRILRSAGAILARGRFWVFEKCGRDFCEVGRTRHSARRYGAGDSDVSSGCAGGEVFGDGAGWAWAPSGFEHPDARGIPRGGRSEAVSRADRAGAPAVAGEEALHRECLRVRGDDLSGCELDGEAEYRSSRARIWAGRMCSSRCEGLRHQLSQGAANWTVEPGDRFTFYKLVDSVEPAKLDKDGHEKDFFDGIDTSLPGWRQGLGTEESKVPQLRRELTEDCEQDCGGQQSVRKERLRLRRRLRDGRCRTGWNGSRPKLARAR